MISADMGMNYGRKTAHIYSDFHPLSLCLWGKTKLWISIHFKELDTFGQALALTFSHSHFLNLCERSHIPSCSVFLVQVQTPRRKESSFLHMFAPLSLFIYNVSIINKQTTLYFWLQFSLYRHDATGLGCI